MTGAIHIRAVASEHEQQQHPAIAFKDPLVVVADPRRVRLRFGELVPRRVFRTVHEQGEGRSEAAAARRRVCVDAVVLKESGTLAVRVLGRERGRRCLLVVGWLSASSSVLGVGELGVLRRVGGAGASRVCTRVVLGGAVPGRLPVGSLCGAKVSKTGRTHPGSPGSPGGERRPSSPALC